jgi:prepilin-type N-terminal cleavage/methylation domain-containing protein
MHTGEGDTVRQRGFSLAETVVAMSIAGIVSLIAMPSASSYMRSYRLVGTTNQIAFDIARARMQAIGQNVFVRIRFQDDGHYIRERSTDGVTYVADGVSAALPGGITAPAAPTTTFNRNGVAAAATRVTVTNGSSRKQIDTNILGRLAIS